MSSLSFAERRVLEKAFGMGSGYVCGSRFSDRTFQEFMFDACNKDIHDPKYQGKGTSKANKLRAFWEIEDDATVGVVLERLLPGLTLPWVELEDEEAGRAREDVQAIATRLLGGRSNTVPLRAAATKFDLKHLGRQIGRMEAAIETGDTDLAIGTAKELIETCCKTVLTDRGIGFGSGDDIPTLTRAALKVLDLVPEGVTDPSRGGDLVRRLLNNLGSIGNSVAELRGLYGTGHGKDGRSRSLERRHARLVVGVAAAFCTFLLDTHQAQE